MVMTIGGNTSAPAQIKSELPTLSLESTLEDLPLWNATFPSSCLGCEVTKILNANPLIPGVLVSDAGELIGMISRRRFLEFMSRPYGLELFTKRSLKTLLHFVPSDILIISSRTLIVNAARQYLERSPESLYEPIVVKNSSEDYRLLDVHKILVAQAQIHEIATQLLQEKTTAQLLQAEKMASLGRMMASIAHEMRNPVNCIGGNFPFLETYFKNLMQLIVNYELETAAPSTQILELKDKIDFDFLIQDLPEILTSVKVSSERLTQVITSLQNFSHLDGNKRKPADIHECINSTLLILKNLIKQGIKVTKNYGDLPLVNCYSGLLSQVLINLISNAIDALIEKQKKIKNWQPEIIITTKVLTSEVVEFDSIVITIADNGIGMSPEVQEQIFTSFFTTKAVGQGTGLGLAISHQIITEKHGGQLRVKSQIDVGTEFEIMLPLSLNT